jgi:hypothetical protein
MLIAIMPSVVMLIDIMPIVVMLTVVAPCRRVCLMAGKTVLKFEMFFGRSSFIIFSNSDQSNKLFFVVTQTLL